MRDVPCEAPCACPGAKRSSSTTSRPRRASCHAAAEPMTPPPTTRWSTRWVLVVMRGSLRLRQAGRVGLRLLDGLGLQAPPLEHLEVRAVLDGVVDRGGDGRGRLVALLRGDGDLRRVGPAAVERADDLEVLRGDRRRVRERRVGADVRL